jgi:hypothetical protein
MQTVLVHPCADEQSLRQVVWKILYGNGAIRPAERVKLEVMRCWQMPAEAALKTRRRGSQERIASVATSRKEVPCSVGACVEPIKGFAEE